MSRDTVGRDAGYFLTLLLVGLVALPADVAAVQALPLGPSMQFLLAVGLAVATSVAAHVAAGALADVIEAWPRRHRVPWRFWFDAVQAVSLVAFVLFMLVAFGLLRGDTFKIIGKLTGDAELQASGWKINLALFGLQLVTFAVALVLGVKRQQGRELAVLLRRLRELDAEIAAVDRDADDARLTITRADNTVAKLDRDHERLRERIEAWARERHTRTDYIWHKQRIATERRRQRIDQREWDRPRGPVADKPRSPVEPGRDAHLGPRPGGVIDALAEHASHRTNGTDGRSR